MGRKNRRNDRIGYDQKEWKKTSSGKWELMDRRDKKLDHEKESLKKRP